MAVSIHNLSPSHPEWHNIVTILLWMSGLLKLGCRSLPRPESGAWVYLAGVLWQGSITQVALYAARMYLSLFKRLKSMVEMPTWCVPGVPSLGCRLPMYFFVCFYCGKSIVEHAGHSNKEQILFLSTSLWTNIHPKPLGPEVSTYDLGDDRDTASVVTCALAIWYCLAFCQGGPWGPRMDMCLDVKVSKQSCRWTSPKNLLLFLFHLNCSLLSA